MGQLVPTMRAVLSTLMAQGPPKTIRPLTPFLPPLRPSTGDACAQAQCQYCKRYGPLGSCQGCGAPNIPVQYPVTILTSPGPISDRTALQLRRAWEASTTGPGQSGRVAVLESGIRMNVVPSFDQVKR
jgi:hypothetical protein